MRTPILSLMVALGMSAQTTVYLRSSAPAAVPVASVTAGTPAIVNTSSAHGFSAGNIVTVWGVCASDGSVAGQSAVNGIVKVYSVPSSTSFGVATLAGTPITGTASVNCDPVSGSSGAAWTGLLTAYSLGAQPLGLLDGQNGTNYRKLALSTANGLTSLVVSNNVATVTTSYAHGVSNGDSIGIWNSGTSALDKNGGDGCGLPPCPVAAYQAENVTTYTFQFATSGVSNGTYSGVNLHCGPASTPNDTIGGTRDCLVVSQLAYQGNPFWDAINYYSYVGVGIGSATAYKYVMDGGSRFPDVTNSPLSQFALAAERFLVDRSNSQMLSVVTYALKNLYKMFGVNWTLNEALPGGGGMELGANEPTEQAEWLYLAGASYLSASELAAVDNSIFNDVDDPTVTPCTKANNDLSTGHNKILASGTAQGGSGTTITLASGTTSAQVPINTIIAANAGGNQSYGLVTGFSGSGGGTPQATVASWSSGSPSAGTAYTVYATISSSSTAGGGTATVTGYGTTFVSDGVSAGDAVFGANGYPGQVELAESFVTVNASSQTSLSVINSEYPYTFATPQVYWYVPQFQPSTSCGMLWVDSHWAGFAGAQPILYPPGGGGLSSTAAGPEEGSNNELKYEAQLTGLGLVSAPYDSRAVRKLAQFESHGFDYLIRHYMNYTTGTVHSGAYYSFVNVLPTSELFAATLNLSVPTFPSLDQTNPSGWLQTPSLYKMFSVLPDFRNEGDLHTGWPSRFGTEDSGVQIDYQLGGQWVTDGAFLWAPTSNNAKWLRNWLSTSQGVNLWGFWGTSAGAVGLQLVQNDPRIASSDFTVQPHQYLFQTTSAGQCAIVTGWPCPANFRGDVVISRTGWSRYNDTSTAGPSGTYLYYGSRVWHQDHDTPQNGTMLVYKVGELLATDFNPPNDEYASNGSDQSTMGFMLQIGGSNATLNCNAEGTQCGYSPIIRWASANHGSWPSAYGDQNSNYAYACSDLSNVYTVASNYIQRCIAHLKQPGNDEFILQWDTASLTSPIGGGIATHVHYSQIPGAGTAYPPGTTTFTSGTLSGGVYSGGVLELETGTADSLGDPTPNFGLATRFLSPGTISITGDGNTYYGNSGACNGSGCTYRVSVCAGSSCGTSAALFESLIIHRVLPSRTDQTLNCPGTWTQTNWFIAQCAGSNTAMVVALARGGATYSSMSGFTTTHSGTAQYLFGGLSPGTYTVTMNGSQVSGSPFTVGSGDGSIEFLSTAGTVSINGSAALCSITTTSLPGGTVGSSYSQAVSTESCTAPIGWSVSSGSLCAGLNLGSSTGVISGIPSTAETCSFAVQAVDAVPTTATEPLSITIAGGGSAVASIISGHTTASGDVIVH